MFIPLFSFHFPILLSGSLAQILNLRKGTPECASTNLFQPESTLSFLLFAKAAQLPLEAQRLALVYW
jgi:hypothetical protein